MASPTQVRDGLEAMGPIDYLVIEFPPGARNGEGLPLLVDLVDRGIIRILDLAFITKRPDGSVVAAELSDVDGDGEVDLTVFDGASSGLLGQDDFDEVGRSLEPDSAAGILIFENRWAAPLAVALRRSGAQLMASNRLPVQAILAALDATEPDAGQPRKGSA